MNDTPAKNSSRLSPRRLLRDFRFWIVLVVALYSLIGFVVVPLVAKRQIVNQVRTRLGCEASVGSVRFNPYTFNAAIRKFALRDRNGEPMLAFADLRVNLAPWPLVSKTVALEEIRVDSADVAVRMRANRSMNLLDLVPPADTSAASGAPAPAWTVRVDRAVARAARVGWYDATVTPLANVVIDTLDATVSGFVSLQGDTTVFSTRAVSRAGGTVSAQGHVLPLDGVVSVRLDVDSLDVTPAAPYIARFAYLDLQRGKFNAHGDLHAVFPKDSLPSLDYSGDVVLDGVHLFDTLKQQAFFGFNRVAILKANAHSNPPATSVDEITVQGIYARIAIAEDQSFNVNDVFAPARAIADSTRRAAGIDSATAAAAPKAPMPDIAIGRIVIDDGSVDFSDLSLPLPFAARVHTVKGEINAIAPDNAAGSKVMIEGAVDEHGFAKATGFVNLFDPTGFTDINVAFRNIELTTLTPYSGKFAGYRIKRGKLSLGLEYDIQKGQLVANHELLLEKLTLGEKVESPDAVGLPVKLAVALLKDKYGNIDLDLEVKGDLNDPKVNTGALVWQAFKKVILKVTTAPFRFLGNLVGLGGDEMEFVEFEPGYKSLTPPQHERLGNLAKALGERPALKLQVHGAIDKKSDAVAIRTQRFDRALSDRLVAAAGGDSSAVSAAQKDPTSGRMQSVLEAMVTESFGAAKLLELKTAHTAAPAADPAATPALDLAGYFKGMRDLLIAAEPVSEAELTALAADRAAAIRGYLIEMKQIPPERVEVLEAETHDDGEDWVRCKLALDGSE